jgi:hypothetical protein
MKVLNISNYDHSYIRVDCDVDVAWELRDAFAFRPDGFQFVPSYKQKLWDGYIRMFNPNTKLIYRGLANKVVNWATERGYEVDYPDQSYDTSFSLSEAEEFVEALNPKHPPRDYQMDGFVHAIQKKDCYISYWFW